MFEPTLGLAKETEIKFLGELYLFPLTFTFFKTSESFIKITNVFYDY